MKKTLRTCKINTDRTMKYMIISKQEEDAFSNNTILYDALDVSISYRKNGVVHIYRDKIKVRNTNKGKENYFIFIWKEDIGRNKPLITLCAGDYFPSDILDSPAEKYNIPYRFYE